MMSCFRFASRKGEGFPGTSGMIVVMPYPFMELELSLKAMTLLFRFASYVAFTIFISVSGASLPSTMSLPRKNQ